MLLNTITGTAQWVNNLLSAGDQSVIESFVLYHNTSYFDIMLQNNGLDDVWVEVHKEAVVGECFKLEKGGIFIVRIPRLDDNYPIVSLVSGGADNSLVTLTCISAYKEK